MSEDTLSQPAKKRSKKPARRLPAQRKKLAGVSITVQRCRNGRHAARVVTNSGGKRTTRGFETLEEAKAYADRQEVEAMNAGARAAVEIGDHERRVMLEAKEQLAKHGKTISDAVSFYLKHLEARSKKATVTDTVAALIKFREDAKLSAVHIYSLNSRLGRFAETFGERHMGDISPEEISVWLAGLNVEPVTYGNYRRNLAQLFNYAAERELCPAGIIKKTVKVKTVEAEPGILTVGECTALLLAADDTVRAGIAVALFAGLRDAELRRLTWQGIDLEGGVITLGASITKRAQRRTIPIRPNLAAWLTPLRKLSGLVFPDNWETRKSVDNARHAAGFRTYYHGDRLKADMTHLRPWPSNALRHSYASYRLAKWPDAAALALEMGNSPGIVLRHYRSLVKPAAADAYWGLMPSSLTADNIVAMAAA